MPLLQGHVSTLAHGGACQSLLAVFRVSAPWFTPPADPITALMMVLTLPPASRLFPLVSPSLPLTLCPLTLHSQRLIRHLMVA